MKTFTRNLMLLTLIAVALALSVPMLPRAEATGTQKKTGKKPKAYNEAAVTNASAKTGAEVAAYVRKQKEQSKDVRNALSTFEKSGRQPKIDDSVMISGVVGGRR